jgi:hypothetical protein
MGFGLTTPDGGRGCLTMLAFLAGVILILVSGGFALFWAVGAIMGGYAGPNALNAAMFCGIPMSLGIGMVYAALK